jgi:hypothetical protein
MGSRREQRHGAGRVCQSPDHSAHVRQRQARADSECRLADVGSGAPRCRRGVYKAGQAKNEDVVLEAADKLARPACIATPSTATCPEECRIGASTKEDRRDGSGLRSELILIPDPDP